MSEDKSVYHYNIEQGTDEWLAARLGIATASEINNIITPKGKPTTGEKMRTYACQKAAERETRFLEDHYQSFDMMRGHFQEEIARDIYSENYDTVTECGFITRKINGVNVGASPDGLVGEDGGIEIKSRLAKFQVRTIIAGVVPDEYINQIQTTLLITGRKWWDFVQYSNGMPMFVKRVYTDLLRQTEILNALAKLEELIIEMCGIYQSTSANLVQTERVEINLSDDVIDESGD